MGDDYKNGGTGDAGSAMPPEEMLSSNGLVDLVSAEELKRRLPPAELLKKKEYLALVNEREELYGSSWARYLFELVKGLDLGGEDVTEAKIQQSAREDTLDDNIEVLRKKFQGEGKCNNGIREIYERVQSIRVLMRYERRTGVDLYQTAREMKG